MNPDFIARIRSEMGLVDLADATEQDMAANAAIVLNKARLEAPPLRSVWFVPIVEHVLKGGVRTIFATAEQMSKKWGTQAIFVVYSFSGKDFSIDALHDQLRSHFPELQYLIFKFRRGINSIEAIPSSDIAFCTLWTTAYLLLKYNKTRKKFYFLQDYEPVFYAGGSVYGVIEATYRFGFSAIANSLGVAQRYRRYSSDVISFMPGIDQSTFHPPTKFRAANELKRVVFYGRPQNDRNAFALGLKTLSALKKKMGHSVEIVSVGAEWNPSDFGMEGIMINKGLLQSLTAVAELYRSSDLGLVFMFSAHPSYQPFEYMACGCIPVTNANENNEWLLQDDVNCLFLNPVPEVMADAMVGLLQSPERMRRIRSASISTASKYSWAAAYDDILDRVFSP